MTRPSLRNPQPSTGLAGPPKPTWRSAFLALSLGVGTLASAQGFAQEPEPEPPEPVSAQAQTSDEAQTPAVSAPVEPAAELQERGSVQNSTAPEPSPHASAPKVKVPVFGPSLSLSTPLMHGKPVGMSVGLQTVLAQGALRVGIEAFLSSPVTAFTPSLGGDVTVGGSGKSGVGGSVALYYRAQLPKTFDDPTRAPIEEHHYLAPGVLFSSKPFAKAPVMMMVPLAVWIDVANPKDVTPTLAFKMVFGVNGLYKK